MNVSVTCLNKLRSTNPMTTTRAVPQTLYSSWKLCVRSHCRQNWPKCHFLWQSEQDKSDFSEVVLNCAHTQCFLLLIWPFCNLSRGVQIYSDIITNVRQFKAWNSHFKLYYTNSGIPTWWLVFHTSMMSMTGSILEFVSCLFL